MHRPYLLFLYVRDYLRPGSLNNRPITIEAYIIRMETIMKLFLILIVLACTGCGASVESKTDGMGSGLTNEQAAEIMAWEVGEWRITGRGMPENGDPQLLEINNTVRMKEKKKS